jgi:hypothetical protein
MSPVSTELPLRPEVKMITFFAMANLLTYGPAGDARIGP